MREVDPQYGKSTNNGKNTKKGFRARFTEEEDKLLKELVNNKKNTSWKEIASHLPGRTACQCRDRYNQYLFKEVVNKPWTSSEDQIIVEKYRLFGPHWVKISQFLPGRSGNNVKNRWNCALTKYHGISYTYAKQERRSKKDKWIREDEEPVTQIQVAPDQCSTLIDQMTDFMMKKVNEQNDLFGSIDE